MTLLITCQRLKHPLILFLFFNSTFYFHVTPTSLFASSLTPTYHTFHSPTSHSIFPTLIPYFPSSSNYPILGFLLPFSLFSSSPIFHLPPPIFLFQSLLLSVPSYFFPILLLPILALLILSILLLSSSLHGPFELASINQIPSCQSPPPPLVAISAHRQTGRQTDRQTGRQTHRNALQTVTEVHFVCHNDNRRQSR